MLRKICGVFFMAALLFIMVGCALGSEAGEVKEAAEEVYEYAQVDEPVDVPIQQEDFVITFSTVEWRGEVLEMGWRAERNPNALFIKSITPFFGDAGNVYVIRMNLDTVILDINGEEIAHTDIPVGSIVELTSSSAVFPMKPAIGGASLIQVVE